MLQIKKLNKQLQYNHGFFNNKNEMILAQALQLSMNKIDELIEEVNSLRKALKQQNDDI